MQNKTIRKKENKRHVTYKNTMQKRYDFYQAEAESSNKKSIMR